jgi:hypothetical protein
MYQFNKNNNLTICVVIISIFGYTFTLSYLMLYFSQYYDFINNYKIPVLLVLILPVVFLCTIYLHYNINFDDINIITLNKDFTKKKISKHKIDNYDPILLVSLIENPEKFIFYLEKNKKFKQLKPNDDVVILINKYNTNNFYLYPLEYVIPDNI